jgi:endonuclease-8
VPEGHTLHRIALAHTGTYAGHRVRADSPQGRFVEGAARIDGRTLERVDAYGKHLLYGFDGLDEALHIHLGLYGKFREGALPPPEPRGAVRLRLQGDGHWTELRGATAVELLTPPEQDALLARLGPDPLRGDADSRVFVAAVARSRAPVGGILMDQTKIAGVGNVYRAEVLFRAGLDPYLPGREVAEPALDALWDDIRTLMKAGVRSGRIVTTRPVDRGRAGRARREDAHYVYRRAGLPCRVCGTAVRRAEMAGRNLFWCEVCQPRRLASPG